MTTDKKVAECIRCEKPITVSDKFPSCLCICSECLEKEKAEAHPPATQPTKCPKCGSPDKTKFALPCIRFVGDDDRSEAHGWHYDRVVGSGATQPTCGKKFEDQFGNPAICTRTDKHSGGEHVGGATESAGTQPQGARERAEKLLYTNSAIFDKNHPDDAGYVISYMVQFANSETASLRAQVEQLCGDVKAAQQDYANEHKEVERLKKELKKALHEVEAWTLTANDWRRRYERELRERGGRG